MGTKSALDFTMGKRYKLTLAFACSLFAYLFLLFFQPFGINNYRPDEKITFELAIVLLVFSLIVFGAILFCEYLVKPKRINTFQRLKFLIWILTEIILVSSITFFFYNLIGEFHDFHFRSYVKHIFEMGSILVIPLFGTIFYFKHTTIVKDFEAVLSISKKAEGINDIVVFEGDYKKDRIALNLKSIIFVQSEDNYASLNYVEGEQIKKYLIRSTLTSLEKKITTRTIIRSNRSTLLNLQYLESSKNVSGRLILKLMGVEQIFEVSKSRQKDIADHIIRLTDSKQ